MLKDLILFLIGIFTGGMNAIAGGGMLIGFPVMLTYGLTALTANATANVVVLPGQISSAFGYRKYLRKIPLKYAWLLLPCIVGALIGAHLLRQTPNSKFTELVPWLIFFAVGLFAMQPFLHQYLHKHLKTQSKRVKPLVIISIAMFPVAIYGGYFGAGWGFIMLAFLGFTKLHDVHKMNALKNISAIATCLASIFVLAPGSFINWHAGLVMGAGSTIGGYCGARYAQKVSGHSLRLFIVAIGIITATYLAFRKY